MLIIRVFASKDWFVCKYANYKALVVKKINQRVLLAKTTI